MVKNKSKKTKNQPKEEEVEQQEEETPAEDSQPVQETKKVVQKKVEPVAKVEEKEESDIDDWDAADSDELVAKMDKKDVIVLENNEEDNNLAA
jgi:hypothetical protein